MNNVEEEKKRQIRNGTAQVQLYVIASTHDTNGKREVNEKGEYKYHYDSDVKVYDDVVILHIDYYEKLFGRNRNIAGALYKRLSVVKITNNVDNKRFSIYRRFIPSYDDKLKEKAAVSYHSLLFLKEDNKDLRGKDVVIQKGSRIKYYMKHPDAIVFTSFILAFTSIFLGTLSLVITILK